VIYKISQKTKDKKDPRFITEVEL